MTSATTRPPSVSVILPTHDRADVLPFAIRSVLAQTDQDFELLIMGDGCRDATARVVGAFDDARIRWFDLPKAPGIGYRHRNTALARARGRLIAYLAHDDLWLPDHLARLKRRIDAPGIELAYSRLVSVESDGVMWPAPVNLHDPPTRDAFLGGKRAGVTISSVVHTRECYRRHGGWDESMPVAGDLELYRRVLAGGGYRNLAFEPEPTCLHFRASWRRARRGQLTRATLARKLGAVDRHLPKALRLDVAAGVSEQQACWTAMQADPMAWSRELRRAVTQVLDARLAVVDDVMPLLIARAGTALLSACRWIGGRRERGQLAALSRGRDGRGAAPRLQ